MIELRIKILGEILWIRKPTKIGLWGASLLPRSSAGGPESESLVVGNCFEHCFWNTITSADCCKVEPAMATRWRSLVESPWREVNTKSEVQELFTATNWTKPPRGYSRVCTAFPLLVSYTTAHPRSVPPTRSPPSSTNTACLEKRTMGLSPWNLRISSRVLSLYIPKSRPVQATKQSLGSRQTDALGCNREPELQCIMDRTGLTLCLARSYCATELHRIPD